MIYPIVKYGQPVLEKRGEDITDFDTPELHQLIEDMFESMYAAKGVGLAAPQIGVAKRLAVIDITEPAVWSRGTRQTQSAPRPRARNARAGSRYRRLPETSASRHCATPPAARRAP